jgi:hypothetical protein
VNRSSVLRGCALVALILALILDAGRNLMDLELPFSDRWILRLYGLTGLLGLMSTMWNGNDRSES